MKTLLVVLVVLVVAVVAVGFWQGWFTFQTTQGDGKVHADLTVNKEKFKKDKEKFKAEAAEKATALEKKLEGLREKARGLSGDEKAKADKEIDDLSRKHESMKTHMKDLEEAGEDRFEELKKSMTHLYEEHAPATGR